MGYVAEISLPPLNYYNIFKNYSHLIQTDLWESQSYSQLTNEKLTEIKWSVQEHYQLDLPTKYKFIPLPNTDITEFFSTASKNIT